MEGKIMNILCKLFGHQPPVYSEKSWASPGNEYGSLRQLQTDGIGRIHALVECECTRCNTYYVMARVNIPVEEVIYRHKTYEEDYH